MKRFLILVIGMALSLGSLFAKPASMRDSLRTKMQDQKQLRKRDSTGIHHDQLIKNRAKRQNQPPSPGKGQRRKSGQ